MTSTSWNGDRHEHRRWAARWVLVTLMASALLGFLVGVLLAGTDDWLASGCLTGAIALVCATVALVVVWRQERKRARRHGLTAGQLMLIGRATGRGSPPLEPEVRPAVLAVLARQRRAVEQQRSRAYRWMRIVMIPLWVVMASVSIASGSYGPAALMLGGAVLFLLVPLSLRRQERRIDAAQRSVGAAR
ncbi:hypothetical protein ACIREE_33045 [Streptomyces sp. NPDC102467]|uniref:hypothetical protein n=1 Tax=Streptomyces sp. NPDC102467 TaxID=3366179 RepID=UPI0038208B62